MYDFSFGTSNFLVPAFSILSWTESRMGYLSTFDAFQTAVRYFWAEAELSRWDIKEATTSISKGKWARPL